MKKLWLKHSSFVLRHDIVPQRIKYICKSLINMLTTFFRDTLLHDSAKK